MENWKIGCFWKRYGKLTTVLKHSNIAQSLRMSWKDKGNIYFLVSFTLDILIPRHSAASLAVRSLPKIWLLNTWVNSEIWIFDSRPINRVFNELFLFSQLLLTGLCIMSLARRRNRYSYLVSVKEIIIMICWSRFPWFQRIVSYQLFLKNSSERWKFWKWT